MNPEEVKQNYANRVEFYDIATKKLWWRFATKTLPWYATRKILLQDIQKFAKDNHLPADAFDGKKQRYVAAELDKVHAGLRRKHGVVPKVGPEGEDTGEYEAVPGHENKTKMSRLTRVLLIGVLIGFFSYFIPEMKSYMTMYDQQIKGGADATATVERSSVTREPLERRLVEEKVRTVTFEAWDELFVVEYVGVYSSVLGMPLVELGEKKILEEGGSLAVAYDPQSRGRYWIGSGVKWREYAKDWVDTTATVEISYVTRESDPLKDTVYTVTFEAWDELFVVEYVDPDGLGLRENLPAAPRDNYPIPEYGGSMAVTYNPQKLGEYRIGSVNEWKTKLAYELDRTRVMGWAVLVFLGIDLIVRRASPAWFSPRD